VTWRLEDHSGPYSAPWEGRDASGWVWEIYREGESRRVIVEISGTAMSIADEFLPDITVQAKRTQGRSEIEKVLEDSDPPRRISLGTTAYLGGPPQRPDATLVDATGRPVAVIEVRNPSVLTLPEASVLRDRFAETIPARFFLIVSQTRGYLFDRETGGYGPVAELETFDVVRRYYPPATEQQWFKGIELELIIQQWLRDLTEGREMEQVGAEQTLAEVGFLDAVRGASVTTASPV
jgi:hypothetical protein